MAEMNTHEYSKGGGTPSRDAGVAAVAAVGAVLDVEVEPGAVLRLGVDERSAIVFSCHNSFRLREGAARDGVGTPCSHPMTRVGEG